MLTICYKRSYYNPNITYHRNQNRYIASVVAESMEDAREKIAKLTADGHSIVHVYNNTGKKIAI